MAKLVRDKIPDIIRKEGRRAMIHIASDVEFRVALRQKLQEEVDEFLDSDNPGELADIIEVILALAEHMGISPEALESLREKKATERGVFQERIILE